MSRFLISVLVLLCAVGITAASVSPDLWNTETAQSAATTSMGGDWPW